jgi:broad specificity phosphatase PhoE
MEITAPATSRRPDPVSVVYVLRHGETVWNVEQRMQGRGDSPLTDRGRGQAARHAEVLAQQGGVDRWLVSPAGRTRATAAIVNARFGAPLSFHEALLERDSGAWEGLTLTEIQARYPESWQAREADPYLHRPPGGENHPDLERRVAGLMADLATECASGGREVLGIITHGVMSRVILKLLLELHPVEAVRVRHPNALFYRLAFTATGIDSGYFMDGEGPFSGLLQHQAGETIRRSGH